MSKVVVKECENYDLEKVIEKINSGIELLGGWDTFVKPGMKVLLKVNLTTFWKLQVCHLL
ncbi:hypothetical protein LGK97_02285 [Clostridium sp. CS001]|uniref:hypothetical protein n=1 Tax=Clostridium sp. CS001 TaxID=2880648 RepID=UPI001CF5AB89|nr:hypothetical protein [Clostridium sp. CS001]MCB2288591.1 hypothetical protein [Clostridium sp. CS001]